MSLCTAEGWSSLLQERAEHIRNVRSIAVATRISVVVQGLEELAILYGDTASDTGESDSAPASWSLLRHGKARRDLIARLQQKAGTFLQQASAANDGAQAEQLRSLSAIFGAEAQRFQAEAA
jgi:hypothetical protein